MFKLEIDTGNAAFDDGQKPYELARILRIIAERVEHGCEVGNAVDLNGNTVGRFEVEA